MKRRAFVGSTLAAAAMMPGYDEKLGGIWRLVTQDPGDVEAVKGDGGKVTLRGAAINDLSRSLQGHLLLARSQGYEAARQVRNPAIDKHPALIAQPGSPEEVRRAVQFAAEYGLLLAVKCGGHSFSGQSTCERGMMIDLSRLQGVTVDPQARRAVVAGGSLLRPVDAATAPHELVVTLGTVSHTGVGGLTTGGGFGRVARRFGLALDNVREVEVVTAGGALVRANESEHPDLFWGVRGGGGNFGIVTSFTFQLHPMQRRVISGTLTYPYAGARDAWEFYGEYAAAAPDELHLSIAQQLPPGGAPGQVLIDVCYSGPERDAARVFAPLEKLGTPVADTRASVDYTAAQRSGDDTDPRVLSTYLKSGFTGQIDARMASEISRALEGNPARLTQVFAAQAGGAIGRVPGAATAFAHRNAQQIVMAATGWRPDTDGKPHIDYGRAYWKVIEPFTRGFYVNDMSDEARSAIDANYGENYARLVSVKNRYDPTNLFRLNANVRPG